MSYSFNCPLDAVIQAAEEVAGGNLDCDIQFGDCEGNLGKTIFPYDGSRPVVVVKPELTIEGAMDVLAHELSHVIVGEGQSDPHGLDFQRVNDQIHDVYIANQEARLRED